MSENTKNTQHISAGLKRISGHINTLYNSVTRNINFGKDISATKTASHDYVLKLVKRIRDCANELLNNERRFARRKYNHSMDSVLHLANGDPALAKAAKKAAIQQILKMRGKSASTSKSNSSTSKNRPSMNMLHKHSDSSSAPNPGKSANQQKTSQTDLHVN